jgi:hypothetical protein
MWDWEPRASWPVKSGKLHGREKVDKPMYGGYMTPELEKALNRLQSILPLKERQDACSTQIK